MNESSEIGTFNIVISPSCSISLPRLQSIDHGQNQRRTTARLPAVTVCGCMSVNVCEVLCGTLKWPETLALTGVAQLVEAASL